MPPKESKPVLTLDELGSLIPKPISALVDLPSKGKFYDPSKLTDGKIELYPMSARDEKLVAGMRGNVEEVIDTILSRCIVSPIKPDDLLVTDRLFLLFALRANSYGEDYNVSLTCPSCENVGKYIVKLPSELPIQQALDDDKEPFEVELPVTKLRIGFRLLRGKDLKDIKRYTETMTSKGQGGEGDPSYLYRIGRPIVSVNGKAPSDSLVTLELVNRLPAKDSAVLKNAYDKKTPGVTTTITKNCSACQRKIEADLPITAEFFRPQFGG